MNFHFDRLAETIIRAVNRLASRVLGRPLIARRVPVRITIPVGRNRRRFQR